MPLSQFDNSNSGGSLQTQRMTADEAKAVIDLWQSERVDQIGLTDHPAVPDVAEGLDLPIEDVQRLLSEVRARRLEEERALAQEQELAEQEQGLAEIQRQRAELRQGREHRQRRSVPRQRWVEPPRVRENPEVAAPAWAYSEHKGLESQRVGRTLIKVCVWIMLLWLIATVFALSGAFHSNGLEPCYVNGEPASADACRGFDQGNGHQWPSR